MAKFESVYILQNFLEMKEEKDCQLLPDNYADEKY